MDSIVSSALTSDKAKSRRYSAEEWEAQKITVERLYLTEDRPLEEVIHVLKHEFGFICSEKQLKTRLTKWGFDTKNLKGETIVELARTKAKRKLENKKSLFRVYKKPVDDRKIDRYLNQNGISEEQLLSMASPVNILSPAYSVFTPQSIRSPTPELDFIARSAPSPTPSLNFQALSIVHHQLPRQSDTLSMVVEDLNVDAESSHASSSYVLQAGTENVLPIASNEHPKAPPASLSRLAEEMLIILDDPQESPTATRLQGRPTIIAYNVHRPSPSAAWPTAEEEAIASRMEPFYLPAARPTTAKKATTDSVKSWHQSSVSRSPLRRQYWTQDDFIRTWFCDNCGIEGGMTTRIDHCPGCNHRQCEMCPLEEAKVLTWYCSSLDFV